MRKPRRRTTAAIALAVPLAFLPAAPALADSNGDVRVTGCSVETGNTGDPVLTAHMVANNTGNEQHDYKVDVKFTQNGTTVGRADDAWIMGVGAGMESQSTDATTYDVSGAFDPQTPLNCQITSAEDEDGSSVDVSTGRGTDAPDTGETAHSYTVTKGDTLSGIAEEEYGDASEWRKIYDANRQTIEQAARDHGRSSSDHGHWIFPGTQLVIPK